MADKKKEDNDGKKDDKKDKKDDDKDEEEKGCCARCCEGYERCIVACCSVNRFKYFYYLITKTLILL